MLPMRVRQVRQKERERAQQYCRARDIRAARKLRARKAQICVIQEGCHEDYMRHLHALHVAALKEAYRAQVPSWATSSALNCAQDVGIQHEPLLG